MVLVGRPLLSVIFAAVVHASLPRTNVLMIVVDDLRPWLGVYNESWISSPNIDALAAGGTVFSRAFVNFAVW